MRNYKRAVRPGFTLYHEDLELLLHLPMKQFKAFIMGLMCYSMSLARGETPIEPEMTGWALNIWPIIIRKIERDHEEYVDKCERQRLRKLGGTAVVHGHPRSLTETENVTETETVTEAGTETGAVTEAPAACGEADAPAPVSKASRWKERPVRDGQGNHDARPAFIPPTVEEVRAFCQEEGCIFDARHFVDYYASKGWMVGSTPMADWRAAARRWFIREQQFTRERGISPLEWTGLEMERASEMTKPKPRDPAIDQANAVVAQWRSVQSPEEAPLEGEELEKRLAMVRRMMRDAGMDMV